MVFTFEIFRSYILGPPIIIYIDHSALEHLLLKNDSKSRLIRWILLLQKFDVQIKDKVGVENLVANHLSRITVEKEDATPLKDTFPDEHLFAVSTLPWYVAIVNYLATCKIPTKWSQHDLKGFMAEAKKFFYNDPFMKKYCSDQIVRRCIPDSEIDSVLNFCHSGICRGHLSAHKIVAKILQPGFYWTTLLKDTYKLCQSFLACQKLGG